MVTILLALKIFGSLAGIVLVGALILCAALVAVQLLRRKPLPGDLIFWSLIGLGTLLAVSLIVAGTVAGNWVMFAGIALIASVLAAFAERR